MMHVFFSITSFFKNNMVVQHTTDEITFFKTIMYTKYSMIDLTYRPLLVLNEVKNDSDGFLLSYLNLCEKKMKEQIYIHIHRYMAINTMI